ncbi:STAS domain-containing protein [Halomonas sabkhae]|uniref:STAS domain-containing protein n=1 Tax=Halomonas sabkhae TaxID=626223 RepID=UPI0025B32EF2|nr:STAS domain-containing protein [Halomonas sabkhae]MDN3523693.1 STAS domain-containing protein [Halomonas sabkhae]
MIMHEGRIQAAFDSGVFVLKLSGDVRLTLCATLDQQAQQLAATPGLEAVMVDLREATNVDSTALGFLAKVAMALRDRLDQAPTIVVDNPDVRRMLDVMGFARYYTLLESPVTEPHQLHDLDAVPAGEADTRERVLEAHRILMHMSEHNREQFQPLVDMLEAQRSSSSSD